MLNKYSRVGNEMKILVVEDEPVLREALYEMILFLQPTWRVYTAVNGQDGREEAQSKQPDLIFVDFQMPVMNGYQMALALKQRPETAKIPLVLSTGEHWGQPHVMQMQTLCVATLFKPFDLQKLEQVLAQIKSVHLRPVYRLLGCKELAMPYCSY